MNAAAARRALMSGFMVVFASFSSSFWCQGLIDGKSPVKLASTCHVGRRERERSAGCSRAVTGSGVAPDGDGEDQNDGFIEWPAPGIAAGGGGPGGAAVVGACGAELAEGDRVAAGFGQGVAAVAEHVCPGPEPMLAGRVAAAKLPGGGDHPPVVG